jgi:hypothetical protein
MTMLTLEVNTEACERVSYLTVHLLQIHTEWTDNWRIIVHVEAICHTLHHSYYLSITTLLVEDARVLSPPLAIQ